MDHNYIINRVIDILNSQNSNLLVGNITSPRPGTICQVSTNYGIKSAYNINCTYPGKAVVVWDKDEEQYYCFTTTPSEVISSRQLSYRKNRSEDKVKKVDSTFAILYYIKTDKKYEFYVGGCFATPKKIYEYNAATSSTLFIRGYINLFEKNKFIAGLSIYIDTFTRLHITIDSDKIVDSFDSLGTYPGTMVSWIGLGGWSSGSYLITNTGDIIYNPLYRDVYFRHYKTKQVTQVVVNRISNTVKYPFVLYDLQGNITYSTQVTTISTSTSTPPQGNFIVNITHNLDDFNYSINNTTIAGASTSQFAQAISHWYLHSIFVDGSAYLLYNWLELDIQRYRFLLIQNNALINVSPELLDKLLLSLGTNALSSDKILITDLDLGTIQTLKNKSSTEVLLCKITNGTLVKDKIIDMTYFPVPNESYVLNSAGFIK